MVRTFDWHPIGIPGYSPGMDCIVVGGGSAGAFTAWLLARKGFEVMLVEQRSRGQAGASWHNDVERDILDEMGLGAPPQGVIVQRPSRFTMTTECGSVRHELSPFPAMVVDMSTLVPWLLDRAESAGASLRFETPATIGRWNGQVREVHAGEEVIAARVVVDARGNSAAIGSPESAVRPVLDLCNAYQAVYEISALLQARQFMLSHGITSDEILSTAAVEGGFSVFHLCISEERKEVALLAASQPALGRRSGKRIVEDFAATNSWVGKRLSGSGAPIPLRPTAGSLVEDGLARVGNAAGQVFPTTGSGVVLGFRGAMLASEAIDNALRIARPARKETLWSYNAAYQTGPGAIGAAYQPLRYLVSSLSNKQVRDLLLAGIVNSESIRSAYEHRKYPAGPEVFGRALGSLPKLVPLLPWLVRALAMSALLERHYRLFPLDPRDFPKWAATTERLMYRAATPARQVLL